MAVSRTKPSVEIDAIMSTLSSKMANIDEKKKSATLSDYIEYTLYLKGMLPYIRTKFRMRGAVM